MTKLKRTWIRHKTTIKIILKASFVITVILAYIVLIQVPQERSKKRPEATAQLLSILGTRNTAVALNPNKNTTRLQPHLNCDIDKTFAVVIIKSLPHSSKRRQRLRESWFRLAGVMEDNMQLLFFIGVPSKDALTPNLLNECETFNDMIVEDLEEHRYHQTLKFLRALKWFQSNAPCLKPQFLIKTEDNMFLHLPNIVKYLKSVTNAWVNFIGARSVHVDESANRNPFSEDFLPVEFWQEDYLPPYASGGMVIISGDTVPLLLKESTKVPLHHLEDAFVTGMVGYQNLQIAPHEIKGIELSPLWFVRLKMAFSSELIKRTLAIHYHNDFPFLKELYLRNIL